MKLNTLTSPMSRRARIAILAAWLAIAQVPFGLPTRSRAEDVAVPISIQFPLLLKILQFDKNLYERSGERIVIGVAYQGRFRASLRAKEEMLQAAEDQAPVTVAGLPVDIVAVDIERENLSAALKSMDIDVVYVTPLRSVDIRSITKCTRARGITSMTGVDEYVRSGISVGVGIWQEKPSVMVNLAASKAEGTNFSSRLLSLARRVE